MITKQVIEAMKRLKEEYFSINQKPDANTGITVGLLDENDIFKWKVVLKGANDSPYRNGVFILIVNIPKDYPNSPPEIHFITPIYHLNVNPHKSNIPGAEPLGHVCMSCLNWWKPYYTLKEVFSNIFMFSYMANPDSPYALNRSDEFRNNRPLYEEKAKYFTKKYATQHRILKS